MLNARSVSEAEGAAKRLAHVKAEGVASLHKLNAMADALAERHPIHPLALMQTIGRLLPDNAVVIDETVSSGMGLRRFLKSDDAQSFFGLRGGGIGWGLPAAIGVKLALPDRPVVALIGDGSAMYTIQGLWTAARENLNVVFVIINNYSYRILKQRTNAMKGLAAQADNYVAMDLDQPRVDFVQVARGLGLTAHKATHVVRSRRSAGGGAGGRWTDFDRCRGRSVLEAGLGTIAPSETTRRHSPSCRHLHVVLHCGGKQGARICRNASQGRAAIVTGGVSGIGAAIARPPRRRGRRAQPLGHGRGRSRAVRCRPHRGGGRNRPSRRSPRRRIHRRRAWAKSISWSPRPA